MGFRSHIAVILTALCLAAGGAGAADPVVVASKVDTEGAVLGNLILLALERAGIPTESRLRLGPTEVVRNALLAGDIDIYPEYTGNGARFFDMADNPVWRNALRSYEIVRDRDLQQNGIVWLHPANANNTWALSVRGDLAREQGLETLDDLARYLNDGGHFKLAASREFVVSPNALPAFQWAYGFELRSDQLLLLPGGDTAATLRAAAEGSDGVNGAMAYGTDGGLAALDLRVLVDTQGVQPAYLPTPTLRQAVLDAYPGIPGALNPVFEALTLEALQRMNGAVAFDDADPHQVAADFLAGLPAP